MSKPQITLFFVQASRCIRTAWLLEELNLDYEVVFAPRENGGAPQWIKEQAGGLGKFPSLKDGELMLYESGNISEYLCDTYDTEHRLLPAVGDKRRYEVLQWLHASEATFALHGLAVLYARWHQKDGTPQLTEEGLGKNVQKDLDYLERELGKRKGGFLCGERLSAADIMMGFSARFILARELGVRGRRWEGVEAWLERCEGCESYKRAVEKTGHKL